MERKARVKNAPQIGVPLDWVNIAKSVRPEQPFIVIEMTYNDFQDWKTSNAPTGKQYSDFFPNFKWKEGNRWGITRNSLCQSHDIYLERECKVVKILDYEMRKLSSKYGPPQAYERRLGISLSKFESLLKYIHNAKIPRKHIQFFYDLPVSGQLAAVNELKETLRRRDIEGVLL